MRNWRLSLGFFALVAVVLALILPLSDGTQSMPLAAPAPGVRAPGDQAYRGKISVEGKQIPLPVGEWVTAGRAASGDIRSVALVRMHGSHVDAAVLIQTNRLNSDSAWGKAAGCERTDLYFARVHYASDHDGSCAYAAYVDAAVKRETTDAAWQQALLHGAGAGWRFPTHWIEATYRITDPRDAIQVRYLFDPAGGINAAAVRSLVTWTEANWLAVGNGFRNRLGNDEVLPDWRTPEPPASALPAAGETPGQMEHLGTKMVTYRIFGTITDISVNYLWLGSLPAAGGLATLGAVASSALYFVHELVWSRFEAPPAKSADLPGVGIEGPGPRHI